MGGRGAHRPEKSQPALAAVPDAGRTDDNPNPTRALIRAAAKRLFDEQGYDATSLRQIAEAVGMTKAAVYYHYAAKDDLLLELTRPFIDGLSKIVTQLRSAEHLAPHTVLAAYLDLFIAHIDVVGLLAADPATLHHPDIGQRVRSLVQAIQQQLAGSDSSAAGAVRIACAMGVIHSTTQIAPDILRDQRDTVLAAALAALGTPDSAE